MLSMSGWAFMVRKLSSAQMGHESTIDSMANFIMENEIIKISINETYIKRFCTLMWLYIIFCYKKGNIIIIFSQ